MRATTTVRLSEETRCQLAELASQEGMTISAKLTALVRKAADDAMLAGHKEAMEQLRADSRRLAEWHSEVAQLKGTLGDGLDDRTPAARGLDGRPRASHRAALAASV